MQNKNSTEDFVGSKGAVFLGDKLLVYLRDNKPGLRFANMWDFPGGEREGTESPFGCFYRETKEEFGIELKEDAILWQKEYPAMFTPNKMAFFFVISITENDAKHIQLGNEGQRWEFMDTDVFLNREDVVPYLKTRLSDYLNLRARPTLKP